MREITTLKPLKHPNIVQLIEVFKESDRLYLVFEYVEQDLKQHIDHSMGRFDAALTQSYVQQLLLGLVGVGGCCS